MARAYYLLVAFSLCSGHCNACIIVGETVGAEISALQHEMSFPRATATLTTASASTVARRRRDVIEGCWEPEDHAVYWRVEKGQLEVSSGEKREQMNEGTTM